MLKRQEGNVEEISQKHIRKVENEKQKKVLDNQHTTSDM